MREILTVSVFVLGVVMAGGLAAAAPTPAGDEPPPQTSVSVERVALFKDGTAFLVSGATLPEGAGVVRLGPLPVPVHGTFWVGYGPEVALRGLVAAQEETAVPVAVESLAQLLRANAGRRVTLRVGPGDRDVVTGTVLAPPLLPPADAPGPYVMGGWRDDNSGNRDRILPAPDMIAVQTDSGVVALPTGSIHRVEFDGADIARSSTVPQKRPGLRLELERPAGGSRIAVSCLARGATWAPAYRIDLSDPQTARFSAHAVVVNELADLRNVQLELITGFPNIRFGNVSSPIAQVQSLQGFLSSLGGGAESGRRSGLMTQQAMLSNVAEFDAAPMPEPAYAGVAEGQAVEDLFLYPVPNFTLKRGETAWIPLFTADMPYRHIYTWRIGDYLDQEDHYRDKVERADEAEEVWHCCRLKNSLKMPLTTAAAEFVTGGAFTGQDICRYTAPGAETTIRINRAMNVVAEQAEIEVARTRGAATFHGYSYDRVKVRGELKLRSRLDRAVKLELTKELSGDVLEASPQARDVATAKGLKQVNPKHVLTWEVDLAAGEERKQVYVYEVFIRN
jgi:hypothetical protein